MRKWMTLLLAAMLLFAAACAENLEASMGDAMKLNSNEIYHLDLDGDGEEETVFPFMEEPEWDEPLRLIVEKGEEEYSYETYIYYSEEVYAADLDGDGTLELLLSGDEASADYSTWCLKFDSERGIYAIAFADANRGENTQEYFDFGYGRIVALEGSTLTMVGSQDMLGTWWCSRAFTLRDGRFELDDDGMWHVVDDFEDPEIWEYKGLTLIRELEVVTADAGTATLQKGEKLVITGTDKKAATFLTDSGLEGTIETEPNTKDGWGFLIDGLSEYEYFEYIPYAD